VASNEKRGRGRPSGAPNKKPTVRRLMSDRNLVKKETAKRIGVFVYQQMDKLDELFDALTPTSKANLLISLTRFATTTYAEEAKIRQTDKEMKSKELKEIKISYESPLLPESKTIEDEDQDLTNQEPDQE